MNYKSYVGGVCSFQVETNDNVNVFQGNGICCFNMPFLRNSFRFILNPGTDVPGYNMLSLRDILAFSFSYPDCNL